MGKKNHGLKYKSSRSQIVNSPMDYFIFCFFLTKKLYILLLAIVSSIQTKKLTFNLSLRIFFRALLNSMKEMTQELQLARRDVCNFLKNKIK